jgi:hypothetical protein
MSENLDNWFIREILPLEAALLRYLTHVWPDATEVHGRYAGRCRALSGVFLLPHG